MTFRAKLVNYFDVWGNEEDGFEINNLSNGGTLEFDTNEFPSKRQMLEALIDFGFIIEKATLKDIEFEDLWPFYEFSESKNGYPLGRLEFEE